MLLQAPAQQLRMGRAAVVPEKQTENPGMGTSADGVSPEHNESFSKGLPIELWIVFEFPIVCEKIAF